MVEKDIGRIKKKEDTDIVIRVDDFGGYPGVTIREFTTSERYTGFTKSGTRIPAEKFLEFREMINSIDLNDLKKFDQSNQEQIDSGSETQNQNQTLEQPTENPEVEEF